ncbi:MULTISPECIES: histidinol-phosphate transaminase [Anaerolinea]|uniref:histidinol-phosphate transaminase n=1 Tax=Anaerolinea TaxID=233189 RepID=UPI00261EAF27|nr:histidinol-phosphate transaminase [Anaerolinea thermophila]
MLRGSSRFNDFPPYTPIEPYEVLSARMGIPMERIVKLDANENPYGPSPKVREALASLPFVHIYPDPESRSLRQALADFTGVPAENLMAGAGADELIDLILRVMIEPGDCVLTFPPTFGMYAFDTRLNAGQVVEIPRRADFSIDLERALDAVRRYRPRVIFLTAPNNPDGQLPRFEEVEALLAGDALVVIDEAYIEFASAGGRLGERLSRIRQVVERENLVVLRTFSKWAGLAGLRVGYGAFPNWLLPVLWKAKQPYNVNVAASAAALASLQDLDYLAENVEKIRQQRQDLFEQLSAVSFLQPVPSDANFILCRVEGKDARGLKQSLMQGGIFIRYYDTPLLRNFIRISVGRPQDHEVLMDALRRLA